jgi:hypothetical protein
MLIYAMQYKIKLPDNYDMELIKNRVKLNGYKTDKFDGLLFKAYLISEINSNFNAVVLLTINYLNGSQLNIGAGNEVRTRDPDLGKVVLYQLSYSRIRSVWLMVPGARLELARPKRPRDFKSLVSTDFTTRAQNWLLKSNCVLNAVHFTYLKFGVNKNIKIIV